MICPNNPHSCEYGICRHRGSCFGLANFLREQPTPPPTDMAEIERLAGDVSMALSALLAAIRKLDK